MKGLKMFLGIGVLAMVSYQISLAAQNSIADGFSPRALFFSPAGATFSENNKPVKKEVVEVKKKVYYHYVAKKPIYHSYAEQASYIKDTYAGIQYQVFIKERNGAMIPVNPNRYVFHNGDKFKIRLLYNMPGIAEFIDVNPAGKVTYLGKWVVKHPFSGTEIPGSGWFYFHGRHHGTDKLVINFYPCDTSNINSSQVASRSIGFVPPSSKIDDASYVYNSLPSCEGATTSVEQHQQNPGTVVSYIEKDTYTTVASRSISVIDDKGAAPTGYVLEKASYVNKGTPITAVIKFKYYWLLYVM